MLSRSPCSMALRTQVTSLIKLGVVTAGRTGQGVSLPPKGSPSGKHDRQAFRLPVAQSAVPSAGATNQELGKDPVTFLPRSPPGPHRGPGRPHRRRPSCAGRSGFCQCVEALRLRSVQVLPPSLEGTHHHRNRRCAGCCSPRLGIRPFAKAGQRPWPGCWLSAVARAACGGTLAARAERLRPCWPRYSPAP